MSRKYIRLSSISLPPLDERRIPGSVRGRVFLPVSESLEADVEFLTRVPHKEERLLILPVLDELEYSIAAIRGGAGCITLYTEPLFTVRRWGRTLLLYDPAARPGADDPEAEWDVDGFIAEVRRHRAALHRCIRNLA